MNYIECPTAKITGTRESTYSQEEEKTPENQDTPSAQPSSGDNTNVVTGLDKDSVSAIWPEGPYKDKEIEAFLFQNKIRMDPSIGVTKLNEMLTYFDKAGKIYTWPGQIGIRTNEGTKVVKEAIEFLKKAKPMNSF